MIDVMYMLGLIRDIVCWQCKTCLELGFVWNFSSLGLSFVAWNWLRHVPSHTQYIPSQESYCFHLCSLIHATKRCDLTSQCRSIAIVYFKIKYSCLSSMNNQFSGKSQSNVTSESSKLIFHQFYPLWGIRSAKRILDLLFQSIFKSLRFAYKLPYKTIFLAVKVLRW